MRTLDIHIGFPKTGTTTLQSAFLPRYSGYVGKVYGAGSNRSGNDDGPSTPASLLSHLYRSTRFSSPSAVQDGIRRWVGTVALLRHEHLILSDEALTAWYASSHGGSGWPTSDVGLDPERPRKGSHPIVEFLGLLGETLRSTARLRVLVTIRAQAEWLASHYAQTAWTMKDPGAADFEKKARLLIRHADPMLEFDRLVSDLNTLLGREAVLVLVHEDGMPALIHQLEAHLGGAHGPLRGGEDAAAAAGLVLNRRQTTISSWQLNDALQFTRLRDTAERWWPQHRGSKAREVLKGAAKSTERVLSRARQVAPGHVQHDVTLSDELRSEIRSAFSASNARLSVLLGRDLADLGY